MLAALLTLLLFTSIVSGDEIDCMKPPMTAPMSCCKTPDEINTLGKSEPETGEITAICKKLHLPEEKKDISREDYQQALECYVECAMNATGLLNEEKKMNTAAFVELVPATSPWKETLQKAMSTCSEKIVSQIKDTSKCKSGSLQITSCIGREFFMHCPDEVWNKSGECTEMKKYISKCSELIPDN